MRLLHRGESDEAGRRLGGTLGLVVPGLGASLSILLRVCGEDLLVLTVSSLLLILCVNVLLIYRRDVDYYLITASFLLALLLYSLAKLAGVADNYLDLADLALTGLLLVSVGYYWSLVDMSSLFRTHTPIAVLASTFVGIHLGLGHPARLALLTILDALASLTVSSGKGSRAESAAAVALFFVLLYASPLTAELSVAELALFAVLYSARNIVLFSGRLRRYRWRVGDVVSLDMVLRPLLVVLT